jgi:hypothetical protein
VINTINTLSEVAELNPCLPDLIHMDQ